MGYLEVLSERTRPLSVSYTLWDTGGAERYRSIFRSHFRGTDVALLVFDVTSKVSSCDFPLVLFFFCFVFFFSSCLYPTLVEPLAVDWAHNTNYL